MSNRNIQRSLSEEELRTPDHPETPEPADMPTWLKKVKGNIEEAIGILTQDGDLQGRGEQLKMDAEQEENGNKQFH